MGREHFDVVVVGAGSSGGVLASRLSEDESRRVLLLEAGPDFPEEERFPPGFLALGNLLAHNFAGVGAGTPEHEWGFWSVPLRNGRRVETKRGKLVGGSSMINGCVAVRAKPSDFAAWVQLGATGWSWEEVRPYFELVEQEIYIKRYRRERWQPFNRVYLDGAKETGFREVEDMNAPDSWDGVVGAWPQNRRNEVRQGTLVTYIRKARGRPSFELRANALVDRVLLSGERATGAGYVDRDGRSVEVEADLVVLSAGAYCTPPILLRSGIGPAEELARLGVEQVADLPVGRNLMEHPQCLFFVKTPPELAEMAGPGFAVVARGEDFFSFPVSLDEIEGLCAVSLALAWEERIGTVTIESTDPTAKPVIDHGYQHVIDAGLFEGQYAWFRELVETEAFRRAGAVDAEPDRPLEEILMERMATAQHPAGSCAIGAVVDPELRVYGIDNLMVADASVFPMHVKNNPNLTCYMVGERAAVKIAGRREVGAAHAAR